MSNSIITEHALADAFKELMKTKSINKITVKDIIEKCGVSRRTFYNHFNDVYELLEWIYENEVIEDIEQYFNLKGWKQAVKIVLQYTLDNRVICLNTFNSLGHEYLENFLYDIFTRALTGVAKDIAVDMNVDDSIIKETSAFFALSIVGEFFVWLRTGLKEKPELIFERIERMMDGTLHAVLERNEKSSTNSR